MIFAALDCKSITNMITYLEFAGLSCIWKNTAQMVCTMTIGELIYACKIGLSGETCIFIKVLTCKFKPAKNVKL